MNAGRFYAWQGHEMSMAGVVDTWQGQALPLRYDGWICWRGRRMAGARNEHGRGGGYMAGASPATLCANHHFELTLT